MINNQFTSLGLSQVQQEIWNAVNNNGIQYPQQYLNTMVVTGVSGLTDRSDTDPINQSATFGFTLNIPNHNQYKCKNQMTLANGPYVQNAGGGGASRSYDVTQASVTINIPNYSTFSTSINVNLNTYNNWNGTTIWDQLWNVCKTDIANYLTSIYEETNYALTIPGCSLVFTCLNSTSVSATNYHTYKWELANAYATFIYYRMY